MNHQSLTCFPYKNKGIISLLILYGGDDTYTV